MYHHDFHRATFGNEPILTHSLPVMTPDAIHVKPITGEPELKFRVQPVPVKIQKSDCELAAFVADKIKKRGAKGIFGLQRSFGIMDRDGSGDLNLVEFTRALKDYRILTLESEIQAVFRRFDLDNSGTISYREFISQIVGEMSSRRKYIAEQAFKAVSKGRSSMELQDFCRIYNAK